jgi:hypothetical protein
MSRSTIYPKQPYIGVDCSGQPNAPPMIAVATRWSRRDIQNKWIVEITEAQIGKYSARRDWQEKLYAALVFKVIDKILEPYYEIQLDKDFQNPKTQQKIVAYLKYLIGSFHSGDPTRENPEISFHTRRASKYVKEAHKKHKLASDGKIRIDEKTGLDHLMKLLE